MSEATSLPLVRDYDAHTFVVSRGGRFIIGGFEPHAKPAFGRGIPPDWQQLLLADQEHFSEFSGLNGVQQDPVVPLPDSGTQICDRVENSGVGLQVVGSAELEWFEFFSSDI
jgi:hypothetical protein